MSNDWYKERNKRTDSFNGVNEECHNIKVNVVVTSDVKSYDTQVMFISLLNILARWCRNVRVICEEAENVIEQTSLGIVASANLLVKEIDPYGSFIFNHSEVEDNQINVFIGQPSRDFEEPYISIDGHGWNAACSFNGYGECDRKIDVENPLGPVFAACLANAELFRWANNLLAEGYTKWYSVYELSVHDKVIPDSKPFADIDLGRIQIVGCGAIGSSFAYLLKLAKLKGTLTFIDADTGIELHNTSSSLLFTVADQSFGKTKAEICHDFLMHTSYNLNPPFSGSYDRFDYRHDNQNKSADVIMCFANDFDIWSTIQHLYPPVVFHATTSRSWGISIGRHIPLKDNCIMCTFQSFVDQTYIPKCAEAELPRIDAINADPKASKPHASILPFLSPAAAVFSLAGLLKLAGGNITNENTAEFNMSTKDGVFIEDQLMAKSCYICKDQSESIYKQLGVRVEF